MKEFIEKLISMLEESVSLPKMERMESRVGKKQTQGFGFGVRSSVEIVNQLAEEYNNESVNDDLISRSALIEEIWKISKDITSEWETAGVLSLVERQPKTYNNGWISCSERLPECPKDNEDEKSYFVTIERKNDGFTFTDKVVFHDYGWNVPSTCEVIAWQPLPAKYEQKAE